jgi:hypothetical protein
LEQSHNAHLFSVATILALPTHQATKPIDPTLFESRDGLRGVDNPPIFEIITRSADILRFVHTKVWSMKYAISHEFMSI